MALGARIRSVVVASASVALAVLGMGFVAPAAHAVPSTSSILITPGCVQGQTDPDPGDLNPTSVLDDTNTMILLGTVTGVAGDVISLVSMCSDGVEITTNLGPVVVLSSSNSPQSVTLALGMDTLSFSAGAISGDVNLVVSAPMSADIDSGADLPPAAPQGLPMPTSGNCADITNDSVYAYGTGLTGGWTKQWGDWAHAWVCARTLTYDGGRWIVTD